MMSEVKSNILFAGKPLLFLCLRTNGLLFAPGRNMMVKGVYLIEERNADNRKGRDYDKRRTGTGGY